MTKTLAEEFPKEQKRVRELLEMYKEIGPAGTFGTAMIRQTLEAAERAAASGDILAMVRSCKALQECQ